MPSMLATPSVCGIFLRRWPFVAILHREWIQFFHLVGIERYKKTNRIVLFNHFEPHGLKFVFQFQNGKLFLIGNLLLKK